MLDISPHFASLDAMSDIHGVKVGFNCNLSSTLRTGCHGWPLTRRRGPAVASTPGSGPPCAAGSRRRSALQTRAVSGYARRRSAASRSCAAPQNLATIAQFPFCILRSGAETTMRRTFWVLALGGLMLGGQRMEPRMFPIDRRERPDSVQQERAARQQELQRSYGHAKARRPTRSERHGAQLGAHCHGRLPSSRHCRTSRRSSELRSSRRRPRPRSDALSSAAVKKRQ